MVTKTIYEERILREIQGLPESAQKKLEKLIRFFKKELIGEAGATDKDTLEFLEVCGTWEDDRSVEEQIRVIYDSRQSVENRETLK
ncbi:MAG TPA: hypothetical protein PLP29_16230 [Candidatus Ozemobacteraceae bacterium]|nr:hypothetical protein [Candidatus Ozemobacteraceae bacterium]